MLPLVLLKVFSTCVEVIPTEVVQTGILGGILHVCGGDPMNMKIYIGTQKYSPRVWR